MVRRLRLISTAVLVSVVTSSCLLIYPSAAPRNLNLEGRDDGYDYAPTVLYVPAEDPAYKLWFCAQQPKTDGEWRSASWDVIMYAESSSPNGPWSEPVEAFRPNEAAAAFDADHTCDPSVVRHGGHYYLYYGGLRDKPGSTDELAHIGVAKSTDGGRTFTREQIEPIVSPKNRTCNRPEPISRWHQCYGAGQPSVVRANGRFYMVYYDDTGEGGHGLYGGLYMIRSRSPLFTEPEHLVGATDSTSIWKPGIDATSSLLGPRAHMPNADMMFIRQTREFFVLGRSGSFVLTPDVDAANGPRSVDYAQFEPWEINFVGVEVSTQDGYGLLRNRNGHALEVDCIDTALGTFPINILDVYIAAGASPLASGGVITWDLVRQRGYFHQERNVTSCS
ncbi:MAG: hypothetical protein HKN26_05040 [Acidimicrobiales bacterium]|nr:hypothetical protein [Acidimicrobiales bacterium]